MPQAQEVSEYVKADVVPKASKDDLLTWWGRWVDCYYLFKVEVLVPSDGQFITVRLVGDAISALPPTHPARQPLVINLRNGRHCWSDLPSTAQLVGSGQFGPGDVFAYLLLTQEWSDQNNLNLVVANNNDGGGGKWPLGAGRALADVG